MIHAIFVLALVLWKIGSSNLNALWMAKWFVLLVGALSAYSYQIRKRWGCPAASVVASLSLSALSVVYWFPRYNHLPFEMQSAIRQASAMSFLAFVVLFVTLKASKASWLGWMEKSFAVSGLVTAFGILLAGAKATREVPIFDNPSMAASFVACTYFLLDYHVERLVHKHSILVRIFFMLICVFAIAATRAATPFAAFYIGLTALNFAKKHYFDAALSGFFMVVATYVVAINHGSIADGNGRFHIWQLAMNFYWKVPGVWSHAFGMGLGTARIFVPLLQEGAGDTGGWYLWMHSDWLQIIFETGIVGFLSCMSFAGWLLYKSRGLPHLTAALAAYGAMMCTNFPLHMPVQALLLGVLIKHVLDQVDYEKGI